MVLYPCNLRTMKNGLNIIYFSNDAVFAIFISELQANGIYLIHFESKN